MYTRKICLKLTARILCAAMVLAAAVTAIGCDGLFAAKSSPDLQPHLIAESDAEQSPVRAADSLENMMDVSGDTPSRQLDSVIGLLYGGIKPNLDGVLPQVKETYDEAVRVLDRYILNRHTEYQRVHAIHDYLTSEVLYDTELLEKQQSGQDYDRNDAAFGAYGALVNKKAVCDGYVKAFNLLCGIEQIRSLRVYGNYYDSSFGAYIAHSWNKVNIGGKWYNVDVTMDVYRVTISGTLKNQPNHGYFLVSDKSITDATCGRHEFSQEDGMTNYACNDDYDFYSQYSLFEADGVDYRMKITSQQQLNAVFSHIKSQRRKIGKIEVQLDFEGYDESNLALANAYAVQLKEAYSRVSDCDFTFVIDGAAENRSYPYARYPRGVFVLLIYK